MQIYEEVLRLKRLGRISAIATIVECRGSSPQKQGAKMLVRDDGSTLGTLGGGCLEADVVQAALMTMKDNMPMTLPFELTEREGGMVCGGTLLVYIEPVTPEPLLVILGGGHVGKALTKLSRFAGYRVTIMDDRAEFANRQNIPDASDIVICGFESPFEQILVDHQTFIVVATRGHNHDLDAVKAALRTNACYIGLMGSRRKKALLVKALADSGFTEAEISRVIIPVGLEIGSVTPEEISVSIMAQIIRERKGKHGSHSRAGSCSGVVQQDGDPQTSSPARR